MSKIPRFVVVGLFLLVLLVAQARSVQHRPDDLGVRAGQLARQGAGGLPPAAHTARETPEASGYLHTRMGSNPSPVRSATTSRWTSLTLRMCLLDCHGPQMNAAIPRGQPQRSRYVRSPLNTRW